MPLPKLERIVDPAELEGDLRDALEMVERLQPADDLRLQTFTFAAQLLLQRAVEQPTVTVPGLEAMAIPRGRGH
jgi:hypothetical protein